MIVLKKKNKINSSQEKDNGQVNIDTHEPPIIVTISKPQMELFNSQTLENFYSKNRTFLERNFPDFTTNRNNKFLDDFISRIVDFGKQYGIKKEINLQKLMAIQIKYGFLTKKKLPAELDKILTYPDREEDKKVNYFHKQLIYMNG